MILLSNQSQKKRTTLEPITTLMLCFVMLCYAMLCCAVLCYLILSDSFHFLRMRPIQRFSKELLRTHLEWIYF